MPVKQEERYYNVLKLNKWFAISSILFTAFWILTFADDYNRPWKKYQSEFRKMEIKNVREKLTDQQAVLSDNAEYQDLLSELKKEKTSFKVNQKKWQTLNSNSAI